MPQVLVSAFYKFVALSDEQIRSISQELEVAAAANSIYGLLLLGKEGINATIAGQPESVAIFKTSVCAINALGDLQFKDSPAAKIPFKRFKIDIREEIVTSKQALTPEAPYNNHLSPEEWRAELNSESTDFVLLDTRNQYETRIGMFPGAIDLNLKKFSEFSDALAGQQIPKEKKVLMYCTGGIRCEKAIIDMQRAGYSNVYQLAGGILAYLEKFPNQQFDGECFVFDHRAAVDQNLNPSTQYKLCPHCGNPGKEIIECSKCQKSAIVCEDCLKSPELISCSKNCAYHLRIGSKAA